MTAGADYTYGVLYKVCVEHKYNVANSRSYHRKSPVNLIED